MAVVPLTQEEDMPQIQALQLLQNFQLGWQCFSPAEANKCRNGKRR